MFDLRGGPQKLDHKLGRLTEQFIIIHRLIAAITNKTAAKERAP